MQFKLLRSSVRYYFLVINLEIVFFQHKLVDMLSITMQEIII